MYIGVLLRQGWSARWRSGIRTAPSDCGPISTRSIFTKKTPSATSRQILVRCMPAATTGIRPCCWGLRSIYPRHAGLMGRYNSSFNRRRRMKPAGVLCARMAYLNCFRLKPSTECTISRGCRSANSVSAWARRWHRRICSISTFLARVRMPPTRIKGRIRL